MLRRDWFLRMIEQFAQVLARIRRSVREKNWEAAREQTDQAIQQLLGDRLDRVIYLSEDELVARLLEGEPTQWVRDKSAQLTALFHEAGETYAGQGRFEESYFCHLKALNLLLQVMVAHDPGELPDFVPRIDVCLAALEGYELPLVTHARLMQHFEKIGAFARAEDALFAMLQAEPFNDQIMRLGLSFYERVRHQSDAALNAGNLPRSEVEAGLQELRQRLERQEGCG